MRYLTIPAAAMLLALAGCERLGLGGGEEEVAGTIANAAPAATAGAAGAPAAAVPADAGVTTSRSFDPLRGGDGATGGAGGKDPAGAAAAAPAGAPGGSAAAILVGRWGDEGDCKRDVLFRADGTFRSYTGGEGRWSIAGDTLTLAGGSGTLRLRLQSVSPELVVTVNEAGEVGRSTRC